MNIDSSPKRDAILEAALGLFAERGFHGTPVPLIAERAEVGAGTVYRYFANKEAIVNALYQFWKQQLGAALMSDLDVSRPARELLHVFWRRLHSFAGTHPRVMAFLELHHHESYLDEKSREIEMALLLPIRAFVEEAQRRQALKPVSPEVLMAVVWGAFLGVFKACASKHLQASDDVLDTAEECVWQAIRV